MAVNTAIDKVVTTNAVKTGYRTIKDQAVKNFHTQQVQQTIGTSR